MLRKTRWRKNNPLRIFVHLEKVKTMTTMELKKKVIRRIYTLEDDLLLEEISKMVGVENNAGTYYLSEEQKKAVKEARQQYSRGEYISNEELEKEIEKWLNE